MEMPFRPVQARDSSPALSGPRVAMAGERIEQATRLSFHTSTGFRWASTDAGPGIGIGGLGNEKPNIIRGQEKTQQAEGRRRPRGAERCVDVCGR